MKIAIIGNAGSGKSTLGFELHKKLDLPLYHLDQYYWKPNWQRVDAAHRCVKHPGQQPFAERRAQAGGRVLGNGGAALVHHRPALGGELLQEGEFDLGVFAHGLLPWLASHWRP